ncbi:hypothetical protein OXYTRIMIC_647 [Oxytricha trifallax]|uniref:Uncharacterized protein n=1 Tax=Oxytricha trifallax TaxID=1172189 RepID=A0A073HY77_9SPIT|nr:hypothetical protein OXYTRIMIC_647 [Oxytricha trifallax]
MKGNLQMHKTEQLKEVEYPPCCSTFTCKMHFTHNMNYSHQQSKGKLQHLRTTYSSTLKTNNSSKNFEKLQRDRTDSQFETQYNEDSVLKRLDIIQTTNRNRRGKISTRGQVSRYKHSTKHSTAAQKNVE